MMTHSKSRGRRSSRFDTLVQERGCARSEPGRMAVLLEPVRVSAPTATTFAHRRVGKRQRNVSWLVTIEKPRRERPQREIAKAHTHPHPSGMSCTNKPIGAKDDEHCRCDPTQGVRENACMDQRDERHNQSRRERMPYSDRRQGVPNGRTPLFLQPIPGFMPWKARAQAAQSTAMLRSGIAE